ncbi:hypothetical protein KY284_032653 [Solanum tuberosum]|nr:hypothetical protein KY284_032653 [Solanum tuberosum]
MFEHARRLKGLLFLVPLVATASMSKEIALAGCSFVKQVRYLKQKSGFLYTALYLKQCAVSLQRYYAGNHHKGDLLSVPVSLTRCGIPKIIPVVLRKHATFSSMASPHPDIGRVLQVVDEIKTSFRDLQPIYLPHLQNIPLELGMSWESTWKSTPLLDNFVRSFDLKVDDTIDKEAAKYAKDHNIFVNLKHEIAAFIWNIQKIHSIPDGFFSPGILWSKMVYYPFDRNNTRFANEMFNYFESAMGPYFSTLLGDYTGVPLATGRLAQVIEGGGNRRIFAICNYIKQRLLFPVHKWAMKVLSSIPTVGTFDQERPLLRFKSKRKRQTFSFDLKSATDHWPLSVIYSLMPCIFRSTLASSIVNSSLGLNTFLVLPPMIKARTSEVAFLTGQPLGYYGSWSLFALSHHYIVWLAAKRAYPRNMTPFTDYTLLGLCTLATKYDINISILQRLGGAGFRARSRIHPTQSKRWERLKAACSKPDFLRKELKPKELQLFPEGLVFDGEREILERTVDGISQLHQGGCYVLIQTLPEIMRTYSEWTSPFNFEASSFVLPFVGEVGKRKRLDNYRANSDPTSKAYGLGHLTKLWMRGIHLHLILLSLASGLGVVKQGGLASSLRQSLGFKRVRRNFLCPMPSSLTIPLIFAFLDRLLKRLTYLMSRQTGQKLLITRRLLQSFRGQPVGRDLTFSLLYEYAYKSTANPFEQDSCKLGSVVLEGYQAEKPEQPFPYVPIVSASRAPAPSSAGEVGFESRVMGDYPARCIIIHFPKRTFIYFFLPRRPRRLKRREKSRPVKEKGRWGAFGKVGPIGCLHSSDGTEEERNEVRGRGEGKRVESIRLDDREKQNEIRIWPKKKQGYGYHDRSPSIKKNLSKSLRVSGAFKHPKYAGIENDIAFLIENDDSFRKTNLFKFFFPKKSRSDRPTSHLL